MKSWRKWSIFYDLDSKKTEKSIRNWRERYIWLKVWPISTCHDPIKWLKESFNITFNGVRRSLLPLRSTELPMPVLKLSLRAWEDWWNVQSLNLIKSHIISFPFWMRRVSIASISLSMGVIWRDGDDRRWRIQGLTKQDITIERKSRIK